MYQVVNGEDVVEKDTREEAIELARELSSQTHRPVIVQDEARVEKLTYSEGDLSKYLYETRGRRR